MDRKALHRMYEQGIRLAMERLDSGRSFRRLQLFYLATDKPDKERLDADRSWQGRVLRNLRDAGHIEFSGPQNNLIYQRRASGPLFGPSLLEFYPTPQARLRLERATHMKGALVKRKPDLASIHCALIALIVLVRHSRKELRNLISELQNKTKA